MKKTLLTAALCLSLLACKSQRVAAPSEPTGGVQEPALYSEGDYAVGGKYADKIGQGPHKWIDRETFFIEGISDDPTYGYTQDNPILVGGKIAYGASYERAFLNALRTPTGKPVEYHREGSCCHFRSPNGLGSSGDDELIGLLDVYVLSGEGLDGEVKLFLNMYDFSGTLLAPKGFTYTRTPSNKD